jgi:hypothetical protein
MLSRCSSNDSNTIVCLSLLFLAVLTGSWTLLKRHAQWCVALQRVDELVVGQQTSVGGV